MQTSANATASPNGYVAARGGPDTARIAHCLTQHTTTDPDGGADAPGGPKKCYLRVTADVRADMMLGDFASVLSDGQLQVTGDHGEDETMTLSLEARHLEGCMAFASCLRSPMPAPTIAEWREAEVRPLPQ